MALFNAADILRDDDDEKEIVMDELQCNGEDAILTLTILVNRKMVKASQAASSRFLSYRGVTRKKKQEIVPTDDFLGYCQAVLPKAYKSASGNILDEYSADILAAWFERFPIWAKLAAIKIKKVYDGGATFDEEDDDEKN